MIWPGVTTVVGFRFLVALTSSCNPNTQQVYSYHFIESFAGAAAATNAMKKAFPGKQSIAMDVLYTSSLDVTKNSGMASLGDSNSDRCFWSWLVILSTNLSYFHVLGLFKTEGVHDCYPARMQGWLLTLAGSGLCVLCSYQQRLLWAQLGQSWRGFKPLEGSAGQYHGSQAREARGRYIGIPFRHWWFIYRVVLFWGHGLWS